MPKMTRIMCFHLFFRFHLHLNLSIITIYPNRFTPNNLLTLNTCSKIGQISVQYHSSATPPPSLPLKVI